MVDKITTSALPAASGITGTVIGVESGITVQYAAAIFKGADGGLEYFVDSTDSGGVYTTLTGAVNGVNTQFTVSQASYTAGTLKVIYQGQYQTGNEITETTPGSGIFDLSFAPASGTVVMADYTD